MKIYFTRFVRPLVTITPATIGTGFMVCRWNWTGTEYEQTAPVEAPDIEAARPANAVRRVEVPAAVGVEAWEVG